MFAGIDEFQVQDQREDISYPVVVVYPTTVPSQNHKIGLYDIEATFQAPVKSGSWPLVVISHGMGSSKLVFRTLAVFLAQQGYVVAMPEHPFDNRNDNSRSRTLENLQDRPRHISQVIDFLVAHPQFKAVINPKQIAVVGHSLGGYTALALAGGQPKIQHKTIDVQADPRVKVVVLLAPSTYGYDSEGTLDKVKVPVLMISGEHDDMTPLRHAEIVKSRLKDLSRLTHHIVKNGTHFSFLSPFPKEMIGPHFPPGNDPADFDRLKFLDEMNGMILEFLKRSMI